MRSTKLSLVAVAAIGALVITGQPSAAEPSAASARPIDVPAEHAQQKIRWKPCFPAGEPLRPGLPPGSERLECGTMTAPQDWHEAGAGKNITIAVSRLAPATGPTRRALFTNPGGPGSAGLHMPLALLRQGRAELLAHFDVYGIDVRGTGKSSTVSCGQADQSRRPTPDVRDRSPQNIRAQLDTTARFVADCHRLSGELGEHITTEQTVADLDLLRLVEGHERISYYGVSGGTWLGAHYAMYFPRGADRFVLDSNAEFTGTWQQVFDWQPMAFERRWREDLLAWTARHHERYGLGSTVDEVLKSYEDLRARLKQNPVPTPGGALVDHAVLDTFALQSMYGKRGFPGFAETVASLRAAEPAGARAARGHLERAAARLMPMQQALPQRTPAANSQAATMYSLRCNDTPFLGGPLEVVAHSGAQGRLFPLYGYYTLNQPCSVWGRKALDLPAPEGGVPPVLMLQSEHDPATAVEGARIAHERFQGSRLVTVIGEGDHGVYAAGNTCVDGAVEAYLVEGVVPAGDLTCPGVGLPDPAVRTGSEQSTLLSSLTELAGAVG